MEYNEKLSHLTPDQIDDIVRMYSDKTFKVADIINKYNIDVPVTSFSELLPTFALHALRGGSFNPKISCFSLTRSQIYRTISDRPNLTNNSVQRANPGVPTGFVQNDSI